MLFDLLYLPQNPTARCSQIEKLEKEIAELKAKLARWQGTEAHGTEASEIKYLNQEIESKVQELSVKQITRLRLTELYEFVKNKEYDNTQAEAFLGNWIAFYEKHLSPRQVEDDVKKISLDEDNRAALTAMYESMLQKLGSTRVVLRFNYRGKVLEEKNRIIELHRGNGYIFDPAKNKYQVTAQGLKPLTFERVLTIDNQEQTFAAVKPFLLSAITGKDVGIFAYGATGAGKTYSMLGGEPAPDNEQVDNTKIKMLYTRTNKGIIPRIMNEISMNTNVISFSYKVVEIYNYVPSTPGKDGYISPQRGGSTPLFRVYDLVEKHARVVKQDSLSFFTPMLEAHGYVASVPIENYTKCSLKKIKGVEYPYNKEGLDDCDSKLDKYQVDTQADGTFKTITVLNKWEESDLRKYIEICEGREVAITGGNPFGSSRSHVLTTIDLILAGDKTSSIYLIDLAGRESTESTVSTDSEISKGINATLDQLTDMVQNKVKKPVEENFFHVEPGIGKLRREQLALRRNPLFILTKRLWTKKYTKIMMFACTQLYECKSKKTDAAFERNKNVLQKLSAIQVEAEEKAASIKQKKH